MKSHRYDERAHSKAVSPLKDSHIVALPNSESNMEV